jgi:GT2 family glycosyltransferase
MKHIATLLTCHNRREKTLTCLRSLFSADIPAGYQLDVYLVDDGSSDGTGNAVNEMFPQVCVVQGDGNLYWNRGMHLAWDTASKVKKYDYYLWLNDDTNLFPDAIKKMLESTKEVGSRAIIAGATRAKEQAVVTYSGWLIAENKPLKPNGVLQECDIIHGNFVLVPQLVFEAIGNLDWTFRHAIGDFDYGLRAKKVGFRCYITSDYIGFCEANPTLPKWCLKSTPFIDRLRLLYSPLGYAEPTPFFVYEKRHFGIRIALKHFISIHLRVLLPQLWK